MVMVIEPWRLRVRNARVVVAGWVGPVRELQVRRSWHASHDTQRCPMPCRAHSLPAPPCRCRVATRLAPCRATAGTERAALWLVIEHGYGHEDDHARPGEFQLCQEQPCSSKVQQPHPRQRPTIPAKAFELRQRPSATAMPLDGKEMIHSSTPPPAHCATATVGPPRFQPMRERLMLVPEEMRQCVAFAYYKDRASGGFREPPGPCSS